MIDDNVFIFDFEVTKHDWLVVFKNKRSKEYFVFHNDNEGVAEFMRNDPLLAGFNNKRYDRFILKAVLMGFTPEEVKGVNDYIIVYGGEGWNHPVLRQDNSIYFRQYDLMDDTQVGTSLKSIEAHLFWNIRETTVSFDIDHPWNEEELAEMIYYCKHDVDATDMLDDLRQPYLLNKIAIGAEKGIPAHKALYMTNAKLTAAFLDAKAQPHDDEREYVLPPTLLTEYVPSEVLEFFDKIQDKSISDEELFSMKLEIEIGGCPCTVAWGGVHGAIPQYREETTETRSIRNKDVASYYPHQMTINGYCSRNIPSPQMYADTIERRVKAKKSGDKTTANALKLVLNTTYGAMLNQYNDLYDPLMGRSVCISGQLQLIELANHCYKECPSLKIIQLNTDGIMVSLDNSDEAKWQEITAEWEKRTGFELEEDFIRLIVQKDVNNYVEVPMDGKPKIKGGMLVRGIAEAGAFKVNNNANIVATALKDYLAYGKSIRETVENCNDMKEFQIISKASSKYSASYHEQNGQLVEVQKVNRVYATADYTMGTLYKKHAQTGSIAKVGGLPLQCIVDNENILDISAVDKEWYIRLAQQQANDFLGIEEPTKNTRKINTIKKRILGGL